jgi:hypothetical protein
VSSGDELLFELGQWLAAHGLNVPPPPITSDPVAPVQSSFDALLAAVGLAANSGDAADDTAAQTGHAEREAQLNDAMTKFPANEEESAQQLAEVGGKDPMSQFSGLAQTAPEIGQGIAGALGGMLQPVSQLGQQLPQAGMQAAQAGMSALQHGAGSGAAATTAGSIPGELLGAGESAGAGDGGGLGATMPAAALGPPPTPSANTIPASSPATQPVPPGASESTTAPRGGMAGMPLVPPGAMGGAGGPDKDAKADAKRVVSPSVKNGAPVQGRIVASPTAAEVVKQVQGKPVATRRIVAPDQQPDDARDPEP